MSGRVAVIRGHNCVTVCALIRTVTAVLVRWLMRAMFVKHTRVAMIWFFMQAGGVVARAMSLRGSMSVIVAMLPIFSMIVVGCSVLSGECLMDVSSIVLGRRAVVVVEVIGLSQSGRLIITDDAAA